MSSWRVTLRKVRRQVALSGGVWFAVGLLQLLRRTWRIHRTGEERFRSNPIIVAFWHGDLLVGAAEAMNVARKDFATLVSRSRDGEIAARLAQAVGITPLRGGSSRGQVEALRLMERWLRKEGSLLVAVDGPRGPRGEVKAGIVLLAARTGAPIIPAAAITSPNARYVFRSWDCMWLPKFRAFIEVIYDTPMYVPTNCTREEMEKFRLLLEERLWQLHGEQAEPRQKESLSACKES